jgi:hypothetical protein
MSEKLVIQAIKSNKGYYISKASIVHQSWNSYNFNDYYFDGVKAEPTFHRDWNFIPKAPVKMFHLEYQKPINRRFILTDDSLYPKIPKEIKYEDVGTPDCNGGMIWKDELKFYRSLYIEIADEQPQKEVFDEFEFIIVLEIGDVVPPPEFKYPTQVKYDYGKIIPQDVTKENIIHQELDRIIFPSLLVHETPAKLSSEDTYKIVREYVKTHINSMYAVVKSDYDFCFEVHKRIPLTKPYESHYTRTSRGRRKPITETQLVKDKTVKFFEMTHVQAAYSGYTAIQGFEGKTEADLKEQVDAYLEELIARINEPLKECPTCCGTGVINENPKP